MAVMPARPSFTHVLLPFVLAGCAVDHPPSKGDAGAAVSQGAGPRGDASAVASQSSCDVDGDGFESLTCGGSDCDDGDVTVNPEAREVCDGAGDLVDEDCDPSTLGDRDSDGDGEVSASCCNPGLEGVLACGTDCNDGDVSVRRTAQELCNERDDDCDGEVDEGEGLTELLYYDLDGDGDGDKNLEAVEVCRGKPRYVSNHGDCDEGDGDPDSQVTVAARLVNSLSVEVCDGLDNDCDGKQDENAVAIDWYLDRDGDGFGAQGEAGEPLRACLVVQGRSPLGSDCNDGDARISPGAEEICDGLDNDCNGLADYKVAVSSFEDDDQDGYLDPLCVDSRLADCNDQDPAINPGQPGALGCGACEDLGVDVCGVS